MTIDARWRGLVSGATDNTLVQLFRYTFVGGTAFVVDFGSLWVLTEFLSLHYLVSAALAFVLGLTTNYFLSVKWVFTVRTVSSRWVEFMVFGLIGIIGLGLNELIIWQATETAGLHYLGSKIVATAVVYFWNFFARKYALFNRNR